MTAGGSGTESSMEENSSMNSETLISLSAARQPAGSAKNSGRIAAAKAVERLIGVSRGVRRLAA